MSTMTPMHLSVRRATAEDQPRLIALMRRASLANPGDHAAMLAHPDAIQLPPGQLTPATACVAVDVETPVGFAVILPRDDGAAELDGLFVEPHLWRCGVGRVLVARAGELARAMGAVSLHVVANPHAHQFYLAVGFTPIGEAKTRFGAGSTMQLLLAR